MWILLISNEFTYKFNKVGMAAKYIANLSYISSETPSVMIKAIQVTYKNCELF